MSESFVPLLTANFKKPETTFSAFSSKVFSQPANNTAGETHGSSASSEACAKPVVTLQRNGDIVSSIRIQCGCGQVVELNCVY